MSQEHNKYNGKAIMMASRFQRVFFSVHLERQLPIQAKKGRSSNLNATCASDTCWLILSSCPSCWQNLERRL